ncbi:hypothetical protein [Flaviaesturariibacter amylovorans]|uniref:F5/8 type C domain-containing protein n=1 Tax=Flaviaesturariibacter amylovorans TaxID=1084520 RepID=A0ABP8G7C8_9BACT
MKTILFALFILAGLSLTAHARTVTAVNSGSWESSSTWSPAAPGNGDLVLIPRDKTVEITSNIQQKFWQMDIRVAGTLNFVGGGAKLWLNDQSVIYVYSYGKIYSNQNSQVIILGSTTVMNGTNSGVTITGPSVATANNSSASSLTSSSSAAGFQPYSPSALPVQFIAFTAVRRAGDVLVQWSTAQEVDALSFEVEMSTDGRSWNTLSTVAAAGNSSSTRAYSFTARNLPAGTLQFRIKQIDINGKYTYTAIRTVKSGSDAHIGLMAAPGKLVARFGQEVKGVTIRVMNANGQVLQEQQLASAFGQVLLPTQAKGYCIVAILHNNEIAASQALVF